METTNSTFTKDPHQMSWAELKEFIASISVQMQESRKEFDRRIEESRKEFDRRLKEMDTAFISQTGHILEGLTKRSALCALRKAGFDVRQGFKGVCGSDPKRKLNMEIDLLYLNTTEAIVVEVKTQCTKKKINHFLKNMRNFRALFPQYAEYVVYVAVAAIDFKENAEAYAREKGVIVIRTSDNVFKVAPLDREKLKRF